MMRGLWDRETLALLVVAAALPAGVAWLLAEGAPGVSRLLIAVIVAGGWQALFTLVRAQAPSAAGLVSAIMLAMLAPEVGPLQFALGVSFGFVFGELIFGGWGRSVLSPAVVGAMFLGFAFPLASWPHLPVEIVWATVPAALLLLFVGVLPWRTLAGALIVLVAAGGFGPQLLTSAVALTLVFLVCDPATGASTPLGRWLYGGLFGGLVALFSSIWPAPPVQIAVSAALLVSLSGPLFDELAVAIWQSVRRRRHG